MRIVFNVFFSRGLNERLPRSLVIVTSVNPGFCCSELRRSFTSLRSAGAWVMEKILARTTEEGSRQLVYAAVGDADEKDKFRGAYVSASTVSEASDFVIGAEGKVVQDKLWNEMMDILSKVDPRVQEVAATYLTAQAM